MKIILSAATILFALAGCAHTQPAATPSQSTASAAAPAVKPEAPKATLASCRVDLDCPSTQLCSHATCVEITPSLAECVDVRVHFDFDKDQLHADDEAALDRAARCILAEKGLQTMVTGNADERGTEEYNLALGDRRARTVARYLEHRGVSSDQLKTVSYGKDRPLCTQHDEACWAQNRRSAIRPEAGSASR